jgi:hypothetical protein
MSSHCDVRALLMVRKDADRVSPKVTRAKSVVCSAICNGKSEARRLLLDMRMSFASGRSETGHLHASVALDQAEKRREKAVERRCEHALCNTRRGCGPHQKKQLKARRN